MGQSLVKNYVHIVFSTKDRQPWIQPPHEDELHAYIGGICKELECPILIVGGYTDHIHILCMLSKKMALMTLVQKIKANSSKWIKSSGECLKQFSWQNGYGAFSVNPSETDILIRYIRNQHQHHKKRTFKEEYIHFLMSNKSEYEEKYLWD